MGPSAHELEKKAQQLERRKQLLRARIQEKEAEQRKVRSEIRNSRRDSGTLGPASSSGCDADEASRSACAEKLRRGFAGVSAESEREHAAEEAARKQRERSEQRALNASAGAASTFTDASGAQSGQNVGGVTSRSSESEGELAARVLRAKTDEAALGLRSAWDERDLKRAYHEVALRLHPDKATVEGATQAFQRALDAHSRLSRRIRPA